MPECAKADIGQGGRHAALAYFLRVRASFLSAFRLICGRANVRVSRFRGLTQLANCDLVAIGSEQASGNFSLFAKYRRRNRPFSCDGEHTDPDSNIAAAVVR